jgi:hypothetical protein
VLEMRTMTHTSGIVYGTSFQNNLVYISSAYIVSTVQTLDMKGSFSDVRKLRDNTMP